MPDVTPDLDAIRKRAEAATPGPWYLERHDQEDGSIAYEVWSHEPYYRIISTTDEDNEKNVYNAKNVADFIAHAREDIPALLSALTAEKERADYLSGRLEVEKGWREEKQAAVDAAEERADRAEERFGVATRDAARWEKRADDAEARLAALSGDAEEVARDIAHSVFAIRERCAHVFGTDHSHGCNDLTAAIAAAIRALQSKPVP